MTMRLWLRPPDKFFRRAHLKEVLNIEVKLTKNPRNYVHKISIYIAKCACPCSILSRVCRVQGLSVQGLSCPGFVCPGFVVSRVCLSRFCRCIFSTLFASHLHLVGHIAPIYSTCYQTFLYIQHLLTPVSTVSVQNCSKLCNTFCCVFQFLQQIYGVSI
jgi:hypothetical protein